MDAIQDGCKCIRDSVCQAALSDLLPTPPLDATTYDTLRKSAPYRSAFTVSEAWWEVGLIAAQMAVGLWIWSVWTWRLRASTNFRGRDAQTLQEEFATYGLGKHMFALVGLAKLTAATGMLASVFIPTVLYNNMLFPCFPSIKDAPLLELATRDKCYISVGLSLIPPVASAMLVVLMSGAVIAHARVKDAASKYVPAVCMLLLSAFSLFSSFNFSWESGASFALRIPTTGYHFMLTRVFLGALGLGAAIGWWWFAFTLNAYDLETRGSYGLVANFKSKVV